MLPPTDLQSFTVSHTVPLLRYERLCALTLNDHPKLNAKAFKTHITIATKLWPRGDKLSRSGRVPAAPVLLLTVMSLVIMSSSSCCLTQTSWDDSFITSQPISSKLQSSERLWFTVKLLTRWSQIINVKVSNSQISTNLHIGDYTLLFINL